MRALRLLVSLLAALRSLRLAIPFTPYARLFVSCSRTSCRSSSAPTHRPGVLYRCPFRLLRDGDRRDLPGSWVAPLAFATFSDPGGIKCTRRLRHTDAAPVITTPKAPAFSPLSRLIPAASAIAAYASRLGSPRSAQGSLPAARHALPGRIGYLQGHAERFQAIFLSPLPRLTWRNVIMDLLVLTLPDFLAFQRFHRQNATKIDVFLGFLGQF